MKKRIHKIAGVFVLMVLVLATLTGCDDASTIETSIIINKDLSGVRKMDVVIDDTVLAENFSGTIEDITAVVEENCPSELTWTYDNSTGANVYHLELAFLSPEDYENKVDAILDPEDEYEDNAEEPKWVVMSSSDSVWVNGIYLDENFSSEDLLQWMIDALVEEGLVDSGDSSYVFATGNTSVEYNSEVYSVGSDAYVNETEYVEIEEFHYYTTIKGSDSFDRTIEMVISAETMETNGDAIKTYMDSVVPSGSSSQWTTNDEGYEVFTVTANNLTAEGLDAFMKAYFGNEETTVTIKDTSYSYEPFKMKNDFSEEIDYSNYLASGAWYSIYLEQYLKFENGYELDEYVWGDETVENGYVLWDTDYTYGTSYFDFDFQKIFRVKSIDIDTKMNVFGNYKRTINLEFDIIPTEDELKIIQERIYTLLDKQLEAEAKLDSTAQDEEAGENSGAAVEDGDATEIELDTEEKKDVNYEKEFNIRIDASTKKDKFVLTIVQKGDESEIRRSTEALFGDEGHMEYMADYGVMKLKYDVAYREELSLYSFASDRTEDCVTTYNITLPSGVKFTYTTDDEHVDLSGRKIEIKTDGVSFSALATGHRTNFAAIAVYLLIVGGIALGVWACFKMGWFNGLKTKVVEKAKQIAESQEEAQETENATPVQQAEPIAQTAPVQEAQPKAMFCTNCGAKLVEGALFCEKCGTKVG